jgi:hypothetical protein
LPEEIAKVVLVNKGGTGKMQVKKMDLWMLLLSLSLPVIRHAGMLQTAGGSALFVPAWFCTWLSQSVKKFRLREETQALCAAAFVGGDDDTK